MKWCWKNLVDFDLIYTDGSIQDNVYDSDASLLSVVKWMALGDISFNSVSNEAGKTFSFLWVKNDQQGTEPENSDIENNTLTYLDGNHDVILLNQNATKGDIEENVIQMGNGDHRVVMIVESPEFISDIEDNSIIAGDGSLYVEMSTLADLGDISGNTISHGDGSLTVFAEVAGGQADIYMGESNGPNLADADFNVQQGNGDVNILFLATSTDTQSTVAGDFELGLQAGHGTKNITIITSIQSDAEIDDIALDLGNGDLTLLLENRGAGDSGRHTIRAGDADTGHTISYLGVHIGAEYKNFAYELGNGDHTIRLNTLGDPGLGEEQRPSLIGLDSQNSWDDVVNVELGNGNHNVVLTTVDQGAYIGGFYGGYDTDENLQPTLEYVLGDGDHNVLLRTEGAEPEPDPDPYAEYSSSGIVNNVIELGNFVDTGGNDYDYAEDGFEVPGREDNAGHDIVLQTTGLKAVVFRNSVVSGDGDDDIIIDANGGFNDLLLSGGDGTDLFLFKTAANSFDENGAVITDFSSAQGDKVDLTNFLGLDYQDLIFAQVNGDTVVGWQFNNGNASVELLFEDALVDQSDFIL